MRVLTLDAALDGCSAGLVVDGVVRAECRGDAGRGQSSMLPGLARSAMGAAGARGLHRIVATVGPGSFTGIRAALSLALGIGLAADVAVVGVTTGAALAASFPPPADWTVWVAVAARRGRVFLEIEGKVSSLAEDDMPQPGRNVWLLGDAAMTAVALLQTRGFVAHCPNAGGPTALGMAEASSRCAVSARPIYVDEPSTTLAR